ncbi:MAG: hypothetical protein L6276_08195 [Acetobacterium sp.]|nr:hypothetical protein [Acetobacterium sp.]
MSSIVKAKWVTQTSAPVVSPIEKKTETHVENVVGASLHEEIDENKIIHEDSVEAMRSANELMKEAIKASQEIKEKSQETGYQEGFSQGYAAGHEEGFQEGTQEGFQTGLKEGLDEGLAKSVLEI